MSKQLGAVAAQDEHEHELLAMHLCTEENGEEGVHDLIWEGCPPEPWGERWQKYEGEAKRMIALVRKHVLPTTQEWEDLWPDELTTLMKGVDTVMTQHPEFDKSQREWVTYITIVNALLIKNGYIK